MQIIHEEIKKELDDRDSIIDPIYEELDDEDCGCPERDEVNPVPTP